MHDSPQTLGCNNGIGGFHKNLVAFRGTKLPGFYELKKCASKNALFGYNKKAGKSVPVASKRKMAEISTESAVTGPTLV